MNPSDAFLKPPPATRRTVLRGGGWWLVGVAAAPALCGCAQPAWAQTPGARSITLGAQQLNAELARRFPLTRRLSGLLDLSLRNPSVRLLPERNGLGTHLGLTVTELLLGTRYDGQMDLDYGLRFDTATRAIQLQGVRVNSVDFASVPPAYRSEFARHAPRVAEQLLEGLTLYEVPKDQLQILNGLGFAVGALQVTAQGLRIELLPSLGAS
ncbi:hypothetical protein [Ottowia sp.]|uniref:hypothetical protein n=1 Tax=Ottowia sp. TaxID=1898956 RepID=UPI003A864403